MFNFTNVILQNMYVRIQASFLCICKLAVNVQNIHKSPALLFLISGISPLSSSHPSQKMSNWSRLFLCLKVQFAYFYAKVQFAYFYAKGVVLRNKH